MTTEKEEAMETRMTTGAAAVQRFRRKLEAAKEKRELEKTGMPSLMAGINQDPEEDDSGRDDELRRMVKLATADVPSMSEKELESHGIYKRFWNVTIANILDRGVPDAQKAAWAQVEKYVRNFNKNLQEGRGLMFVGGVGTMKTTMAVAILRHSIDNGRGGFFIPMSSLLDTLSDMRERHDGGLLAFENRIRNTPLLVLDDLGAEYDHTWVQCKVDAIINERYNRMRSTIVTSNLAPADIRDRYQLRIFDRLKNTNQLIVLRGDSLRTTAKG